MLQNPIIWSRVIDFTLGSHLWTEELLRRAADCPLSLVSLSGLLGSRRLARELKHVSRFGRYDCAFTVETWPLLLDKLHQPAPYLEELCLRGRCDGQYKLPSTIFSGNAPRLRRLLLESCSFDEALPYLPQLTHLRETGVNATIYPSIKWLDILPSMPLLTVLELSGVDIGTRPHAVIHLPNLTKITMTASLRETSVFLSSLILPATCDVNVTAQNAFPGADFDVSAGVIVKKLQFYLSESIGSDHCLYLDFGINFFVINNREVLSRTELEPRTIPYIHFHVSWTTPGYSLLSIFPYVAPAFAVLLSQVTFLELSLNYALTSEARSVIANVLRQANNVTSLVRLDGTSAKILLQLGGLTSTQTEDDVIFPSLRSIHVSKSVMQPYGVRLDALKPFVDLIQYRISVAAPIEEICYTTSISISWDNGEVEYLKETGIIVTERDWRGAPIGDRKGIRF